MTIPSAGTASLTVMVTIISLVRLTIPPWKDTLTLLRLLAEKVTSAIGESLEISVAIVPKNALVVTADEGLIMLSSVMSTWLMYSLPEKRLLTMIVLPDREHEKVVTEFRLTMTLLHVKPDSWVLANCEGKIMVAVAEEATKVEFQSVGLSESS